MSRRGLSGRDLTVVAVPFYFAAMGLEYVWLRRRAAARGPSPGDYERRDTVASLAMGVGSLVAPLVAPRVLRPITPGRGRLGRAVVGAAVGAAAVTTAADVVVRRRARAATRSPSVASVRSNPSAAADDPETNGTAPKDGDAAGRVELARRVASAGGVATVALGGLAVTTTWTSLTASKRFWRNRILTLGSGPAVVALAVVGWDFIYYWNHRFMHESRYMWAMHVVHHSSERYNLSTALRQPVADALATSLPYGILCLFGIAPELVETARGVNLLYQFWIHTETIGRLGPPEIVLNTPSHHRVHHGSNRQYLDRNHGSILILWDRLFGTFEPEDERPVYGLTKNIDSFNLARIATHEYADMLRDIARSTTWRERLSSVVRGPGWAKAHWPERMPVPEAEVAESAAGFATAG